MSSTRRLLTAGLAGLTLLLLPTPAGATDGDLPPGRRILDHTVRPGETVTGLAVRYHAWTAELISHNHLGSGAGIRVGQHLEIPQVLSALPHAHEHRHHQTRHHQTRHHQTRHHQTRHHQDHSTPAPDPGTATVRRTVARTAVDHGVDPQLALAVSWQESGWQMDRRSEAGAIGAMQVLPATGSWMSMYTGRRLHLHRLADNATAGVELLRVLADETGSRRHQVGAYYQGLGAVRSDGLYTETRHYVANVLAIKNRLEAGRPPA
ncbi:transglycosylase SLT domain-containing protein [Nocardioides sp. MAHUQ-72]|uniref:transglycosylase SLT domain-containing protein n=1 Tax=unclassified Nocardioides TaxID=2615069 RepID=UPI003622F1BA